ncbi:MAG: hypothetical protein PVJ02_16110 [Gemmatimonadota bacterium]
MTPPRRRGAALPLILAALLAAAFYAIGTVYQGWALRLGSTQEPTHAYLVFLAYFVSFGAVGTALLAVGLLRLAPPDLTWRGWDEGRFLAVAAGLGFLLPLLLRIFVLSGADIADDESVYRFSARILLSGHLTAPSPPLKLFFDHAFVVNDGRMFSQYFLGWPALLAPGVALGAPGLVNPLLSAATVPGLYLLTREMTSRAWAQMATVLFLASPLPQLLAATQLSHTATLAALTWVAYLAVRSGRTPAPPRMSAALAVAFCVAFFVRPLAALGVGLPFLVLWLKGRSDDPRRGAALVAFMVPAAALAALFLGLHGAETGSVFRTPYAAWVDYARANAFRFSGLDPTQAGSASDLAFRGPALTLRSVALGLIRLSPALFGWPTSFLLVPLALGVRRGRVFWASLALFLLLHASLKDAGIDTLGPVHYAELTLPLVVLSAMGLRTLAVSTGRRIPMARRLAVPLGISLVTCSMVLYWPARLRAVFSAATLSNVPGQVLAARNIHDAVVFSTMPYALPCNPAMSAPSTPFVRWWPLNRPDLGDDVIHANHLSTARDRELMASFPGRRGWIAQWRKDCTLALIPLDAPAADTIPDGIMRVYENHVERYDGSDPAG